MKRMIRRALAALVLATLLLGAAMPASAMVYGSIDRYDEASLKIWDDSSAFATVGKRVRFVMTRLESGALKKLTLKSCASSDPKVASVTAKGWVKTLKAGSTRIKLKSADGAKYTVKLTVVKSITPKSISFSKQTLTARVGTKLLLAPYLRAKPVTGLLALNQLTWKSADKSVATVDKLGVVTPRKAGKVKITATSGKLKATVTVKVKK